MSEKKIGPFTVTKCKGCGAEIFFAFGVPWYARKVPVLVEFDHQAVQPMANPPEFSKKSGYVSHFVNCPKASNFSGGGGGNVKQAGDQKAGGAVREDTEA